MPHSLRTRLSGLRYKKVISDKDYNRLCKALDNEGALDKIRAEIKSHELDPNDTDQFGTGVNFGIGYALGIIDKYKAESEVEE